MVIWLNKEDPLLWIISLVLKYSTVPMQIGTVLIGL